MKNIFLMAMSVAISNGYSSDLQLFLSEKEIDELTESMNKVVQLSLSPEEYRPDTKDDTFFGLESPEDLMAEDYTQEEEASDAEDPLIDHTTGMFKYKLHKNDYFTVNNCRYQCYKKQ